MDGGGQRRWVVERAIRWLGDYRRMVVRYDCSLEIYPAFFHIASFIIVLQGLCNSFYHSVQIDDSQVHAVHNEPSPEGISQ